MAKQVRETKAGKSISAWVILKGRKGVVAEVHAHYSDAGIVTVDVWDQYALAYQGKAGGSGYDKITAAMSGAVIQGIRITDRCAEQKKPPKGRKTFPHTMKEPKGFRFANYNSEEQGWGNCFRISGLEILEAYGFTVHRVL